MRNGKMRRMIMGGIIMGMASVAICGCADTSIKATEVKTGNKVAGISVHDPAIVKDADTYYIFGSHMAVAKSDNLIDWKIIAEGVNKRNPVLGSLFDDNKAFEYTDKFTDGGYAVWAPDVMYNEKLGKWVMYFCTSHDYMTSNLCMAFADCAEGPYTYQATLLYSGFTSKTVEKTNFYEICGEGADVKEYLTGGKYNNFKYPNCIDANIFRDKEGKLWLSYGSWSGGIWLLAVDEETGLLIHPESNPDQNTDVYFGKRLIGGLHNSCEGPYIFYNKDTDYYYLTVSYGELTREGGYQIRVFRSENVDGPYVDTKGETLGMVPSHDEYGLKMMGNYKFPSLKTAYMAPGHNSVLQDDDGKMYIIYHQRMDSGSEYHEPRVHQMFMTKTGWPVAAPFATNNETLSQSGYTKSDVEGTWYFINHETDISATIHEAAEVKLKGEKLSSKELSGSYALEEGTVYMDVTIGEEVFSGVLVNMEDEAGNSVLCFMGVSNSNETCWGVKYLK